MTGAHIVVDGGLTTGFDFRTGAESARRQLKDTRRSDVEKRSRDTTPWDEELSRRPGWEGLRIWWLVDKDETGTEGITMNIAEFPPQKAHEVHRHGNALELAYIESGSGLFISKAEPIRVNAGEVAVAAPGEWHGFYNDTDEVAVMITVWPGVDRYADLGYEAFEGWEAIVERYVENAKG
jgi:quercetin dioxygenase-like cupin family protein